jgi:choline dehydrogenase-like flavoprotein
MTDDAHDVIVIGAGVCGAVSAWLLAQRGARVLLLEAGEVGPERLELVGAYARAARKSPGSPYLGRAGDTLAPSPESSASYYQHAAGADPFKSTYLRRVGGTTWHFLGNTPRFLPSDFRLQSTHGVGRDWPIGYDELEADYCRAEELIGVAGRHEEWNGLFGARRSRPFPMPEISASYSDRLVKTRLAGLVIDGVELQVLHTPQARNSVPYDGRPPCAGNSSCVPICPIQAKYDATVHVRKALAAGVELRSEAVVHDLVLDPSGQRVAAVRYRRWDGSEHAARARLVILAAHSIEAAKLLLLSHGRRGIARGSGLVGCNLMDHLQDSGGALLPEPVYPFRGPPTTSGIDAFRDGAFRHQRAAFRLSLGNDGWGRSIEPPAAMVARLVTGERLFGTALRRRLEHDLTRQFRISISTEMLPEAHNRVILSSELDALGLPRPELHFQVPRYNLEALAYARTVLERIFRHLGASQLRFQDSRYSGAGHIMGTTCMGNDARTSVVDSHGRCHEHQNLFIFGSSVFPTCGTANPTLTALALTLRGLGRVADDLALGVWHD